MSVLHPRKNFVFFSKKRMINVLRCVVSRQMMPAG